MHNSIDDFLAARSERKNHAKLDTQRQSEQQARINKLLMESGKVEWKRLQEDVETATEGKKVEDKPFQWQPISGSPSLLLGNVAAIFMCDGEFNGIMHGCHIRFTRRGSNFEHDGASPIDPIVWQLTFATDGVKIFWTVNGNSRTPWPSKELAIEIAKKLVEYHDEYEAAHGR
jgi:hypothetical protein